MKASARSKPFEIPSHLADWVWIVARAVAAEAKISPVEIFGARRARVLAIAKHAAAIVLRETVWQKYVWEQGVGTVWTFTISLDGARPAGKQFHPISHPNLGWLLATDQSVFAKMGDYTGPARTMGMDVLAKMRNRSAKE